MTYFPTNAITLSGVYHHAITTPRDEVSLQDQPELDFENLKIRRTVEVFFCFFFFRAQWTNDSRKTAENRSKSQASDFKIKNPYCHLPRDHMKMPNCRERIHRACRYLTEFAGTVEAAQIALNQYRLCGRNPATGSCRCPKLLGNFPKLAAQLALQLKEESRE